MDFTPREIATAIWLSVILIFVVCVAGKSFLKLLRAFTHPAVMSILGVSLLYIAASIAALFYFDLWEFSNLKTTLFWTFMTASVGVAKASQLAKQQNFLAKTFRETLSITIFTEFLMDTYTFNIWVELVLVPFILFLALLLGKAKADTKYQQVSTFLQWVLAIISLIYIGHALFEAIQHYKKMETADTAREIFLPVILSLLFMPFLYLLNLYAVYDEVFGGLNWALRDPELRRYAKYKALLRYGNNIEHLKQWGQLVMMMRPNSRDDINRLFDERN